MIQRRGNQLNLRGANLREEGERVEVVREARRGTCRINNADQSAVGPQADDVLQLYGPRAEIAGRSGSASVSRRNAT